MSITSSVQLSFSSASHNCRIRRTAWCDLAVAPATNSRRMYLPAGRVARDFSKAFAVRLLLFAFKISFRLTGRPQIQTDDHALGIGKVAYNGSHGFWQFTHHRGGGQ